MPKLVSENEKKMIREALHKKGIQLIQKKGLRHVTVTDLTKAVGIATGTFYSYYPTKEELLYEIFMDAQQKMLDTVLGVQYTNETFYDTIIWALSEIYLAPNSIALYIQPEDIEYLIRKLPDKAELKADNSHDNFKRSAQLMGLDDSDTLAYGVLSYLMEGLQTLAVSKSNYGEVCRQEALKLHIKTIADFLQSRRENRD